MNEQALSELKDIHLPPEPSWWPLAWGYYLVFVILAAVIITSVVLIRAYLKRKRVKRLIRKEFEALSRRFLAETNVSQLQTDLSWLIRRMARLKAKKASQATISSLEASVRLLFKKCEKTQRLLELLEKDRFKPQVSVDGHELLRLASELIL